MRLLKRIPLSLVVLWAGTLACAVPSPPAPAPGPQALNTIVAATVFAARTQSAIAGIPPSTEPASPTFTPGPPTLTPTDTSTFTPVFTPTPLVPLISVSVATNCRSGPGRVYDYRGALLVG